LKIRLWMCIIIYLSRPFHPARIYYYPRWVAFTTSLTFRTAERFATLNAFVGPAGLGVSFLFFFFFDFFLSFSLLSNIRYSRRGRNNDIPFGRVTREPFYFSTAERCTGISSKCFIMYLMLLGIYPVLYNLYTTFYAPGILLNAVLSCINLLFSDQPPLQRTWTIQQLLRPTLKRLDHDARQLRRHSLAQCRVHRIRKLKVDCQMHLRLFPCGHRRPARLRPARWRFGRERHHSPARAQALEDGIGSRGGRERRGIVRDI
jgi:hypothetical protein